MAEVETLQRTETPENLLTVDEFTAAYGDRSVELVRGKVRAKRKEMSPASANHGVIAMRIGARLLQWVEEHDLGEVCAAETGFILSRNPNTVRAPDAAFIARERIGESRPERGFWPVAPDLAVEVMSPNNTTEEIEAKIREYFASGTRLIWVIYPSTRTVHVYDSAQRAQILAANETIDGGELLSGFACESAQIFR